MQQQESERTSSNMLTAISSPITFSSPERDLIPMSQYFPEDQDTFVNLYSSIFHFKDSPPSPIPMFPTLSDNDDDGIHTAEHQLHTARLSLRCRQLDKRYGLCLSRLHDAMQELDTLRQENTRLRKANADLTRRLNPLKEINLAPLLSGYERSNHMTQPLLVDDLRQLSIGGDGMMGEGSEMMGYGEVPIRKVPRVPMPKSISIRSSGYIKTSGSSNRGGRVRVSNPVLAGAQRAYAPTTAKVSAATPEEEALEFDVFTQGMFKTELCNKWEENGTCPYGDRCQFAHGVAELRPVIRHPRYKTEICRMVLAGETCPYGYRCHFRHALLPEDHYYLTSPGFTGASAATSMAP